jgi:hypothetical protein
MPGACAGHPNLQPERNIQMPSPKKKAIAKTSPKLKDLKAKKNPKGGAAVDYFLKIDGIKGESAGKP